MTAAIDELRDWAQSTRELLDRLDALIAPANDSGETLDEWAERWFRYREERYSSTERERTGYQNWIAPTLGKRPVASISRQELSTWCEDLDASGKIRWTTIWRVWTVLRAMMRDAAACRDKSLQVRQDNPTVGLRGPEKGRMRGATFLWPSEFLQLVSCSRIHLRRRRLYALAIYLYARAGELAALCWEDVDLTTGRVHVHRAYDARGRLGRSKTEIDRQFVAERTILPLLRAMQRPEGAVIGPWFLKGIKARQLRRDLLRAGCDREDLHADDDGRRPLTFHDLRATGITWQAMRGDPPTDIQERVGHLHYATTERYVRRGRLLVARSERVFPPLPRCLTRG